MDRMMWDLATLQYYCWAGRAGWEADSDYAVYQIGRLPGTSESTGVMGRLQDPVPRQSRAGQGTSRTTSPTTEHLQDCNGTDLLIQQRAHRYIPLPFMESERDLLSQLRGLTKRYSPTP